jgi:hypothetical protein
MKKYVWAFINFGDNELKMGHGRFPNEEAALICALKTHGRECDELLNADEIKEFAFDVDCMVGAYAI